MCPPLQETGAASGVPAPAADTSPEAIQARNIAGKLRQQLQGVATVEAKGNKIQIKANPGEAIDEAKWSGLRTTATHTDSYLLLSGIELAYQDRISKVFKRLIIGNYAATELLNAMYGKYQSDAQADAIDKDKGAWSTVFPELKNADDLDAAFVPISGVRLKGTPKGVIEAELIVGGNDPGGP